MFISNPFAKFAPYFVNMKRIVFSTLITLLFLSSCGSYNKVLVSRDFDNRYETAKAYYAEGSYRKAANLLVDMITSLKGTDKAQESLFMLAMCEYNDGDNETASTYFRQFYGSYPKGDLSELARYYSGVALYRATPDPRLDQSSTTGAMAELQTFMEFYPNSQWKPRAQIMVEELRDKLVEKEFLAAKLYYNLGSYFGNCTSGGNNFQACITTVQNTLRDYPYSKLREELYILNLRAKYELAKQSVSSKTEERFRDAIDEYYGFKNEFPESKYMKEADRMFANASKNITSEEE